MIMFRVFFASTVFGSDHLERAFADTKFTGGVGAASPGEAGDHPEIGVAKLVYNSNNLGLW